MIGSEFRLYTLPFFDKVVMARFANREPRCRK
jgi:hypothetical protein